MPPPDFDFIKLPDEALAYTFDWSLWLEPGQKITSYHFDPDDGISITKSWRRKDRTVAVVSGGRPGKEYELRCTVIAKGKDGELRTRCCTTLIPVVANNAIRRRA
jgi:hypothetical protein